MFDEVIIRTVRSGLPLNFTPKEDTEVALTFIKKLDPMRFMAEVEVTDEEKQVDMEVKEIIGEAYFSFRFVDNKCDSAVFNFGESLNGFTYTNYNKSTFSEFLVKVDRIINMYVDITREYENRRYELSESISYIDQDE